MIYEIDFYDTCGKHGGTDSWVALRRILSSDFESAYQKGIKLLSKFKKEICPEIDIKRIERIMILDE